MFNVKGCSSALKALELARFISLKCKINPTFLLSKYYVALLRHLVLIVIVVVLSKSSRLNSMAVSIVQYVIFKGLVYKPIYYLALIF